MPTVEIGGNDYPAYADIAFADLYLAADALRAARWAAITDPDTKGRYLVSATRLLQRLCWTDGAPDPTVDPVLVAISEATSLMAADIALKPATGDSASTGTDIKRAKAGSAEVEFFRNFDADPLPAAAWDILIDTGLLCESGETFDGAPYISGSGYPSRFDDDYDDLNGNPAVDSYYG